ncbi:hypothetical protein JTE90_017548 [Oedothorax gibbosus]|uniref:Uncharacterized protein n=1 Tax=Oedothorax gibbosus TaxID=931172 RepID=A0AAV6UM93_9ARAC|nr:hypothetical protein JTE90_017548 [Oedothorax gibbosus]
MRTEIYEVVCRYLLVGDEIYGFMACGTLMVRAMIRDIAMRLTIDSRFSLKGAKNDKICSRKITDTNSVLSFTTLKRVQFCLPFPLMNFWWESICVWLAVQAPLAAVSCEKQGHKLNQCACNLDEEMDGVLWQEG